MQMVRNKAYKYYQTLEQYFNGICACCDTANIANILKLKGIF